WLGRMLPKFGAGDLLMITADHGCDPTPPGTDHTREYVPLLVYGPGVKAGVNLGTRDSFADVGKTIATLFGLETSIAGSSIAADVIC
ncbi:MAG: phosphopentomutase, partial [Oscillospiraceae bacterium]|nr:phosphopentomutase [Oscillospiraceae bacterium]